MPTIATGPYLEAAERAHDGLQRVYFHVGAEDWHAPGASPRQFVSVGADWIEDGTGITGNVYDCMVVDGMCAKLTEVP